ncbi:MAG: hypothetical protein IMY70_06345, partial [Bacteroidetes bacterium]|nr:hypothetical protein [Bacteroidota bacterium]
MRSLFCISMIVLGLSVYAQTPNAFQYQGIIRDASGNVISSDTISLKFSILSGSSSGTSVYSETHLDTTNQFGLISMQIGNGTVVSGNFNSIDWGANVFFLKVEIDTDGGTNYQEMGTSQLLAVPYALHSSTTSDTSHWKKSTDTLYTDKMVGIGTAHPERRLHIVENDWQKQFRVQRNTETIDLNPNSGTGPSEIRSSKHLAIYDDVGYLLLKNGRLGIGVSEPIQALDVNGNVAAGSFFGDGSFLTGTGDNLGNHNATSTIYLNSNWITGNGNSGIFINNSGYIGIGTSSALNRLAVNGGITVGASYMGISNVPVNGLLVQGQVLIGTTDPLYSQKLVVSGDVYAKEDLYIDGGIYDSGGGSTGNDGQVLTANGSGGVAWEDQIPMDYVEAWS